MDGFIKRGLLFGGRARTELRKVDVHSRSFHIACDQPIGGDHLVEPGKFGFVGVTVVAGVSQDLFYFGRRLQVSGYRRIAYLGPHELETQEDQ
jgi:hypothetical protein